ncbi:MAG TPA: TetR/AcrR family transcriptional regulator [Myxococcota bacterium]|nr:TetR/AcrR family transcriptional regulator [Myxococcota bacterium]
MAAKVDGNTVRTRRTRARILAESLRLFNEEGEVRVTTGRIADSLGISPGNLYYHFRNKDEIVEELFAAFEGRVDLQPGAAPAGPEAIEDLWLYLHLLFEAIREYRFLYRNLDDLVARNRRLRERYHRIVERKLAAVVALCEGLVRVRAMRARPDEIRALAANVLVVATYWLSFQALRRRPGRAPDEGAELGRGAFQVMALVAPYLAGEACAHLDRLGRSYIDEGEAP